MDSGARPGDWIKEAALTAWREIRLFGSTAVQMLRRPRQFGTAFGQAQFPVLNPIAFTASTLAIATALAYLDAALWPHPPDGLAAEEPLSLVAEALDAAGMYLHLAALGLLSYGFLRLVRRRGPVGGAIAVALYAGGVATLLACLGFLVVKGLIPPLRARNLELEGGRDPAPLVVAMFAPPALSFSAFVWMLVASLGGLFRIKGRWPMLAVFVAFLGTGAFFGYVEPPGSYGLHARWKLEVRSNAMSFRFAFPYD